MERSIGDQINDNNWRQGSIIKNDEFPTSIAGRLEGDELILAVTTQSCDLVHGSLEDEPVAECIACHFTGKENGNYAFAKNPRRLHISISDSDGSEQPVEILAHRLHRFPREELAAISPSQDQYLSEKNRKTLVRWLASRYDRPAFPDKFNDRLKDVKEKLKKRAVQMSEAVTGLHIEINPMEEIPEGAEYHVNLLALVSIDFSGDMAEIIASVEAYADLMNETALETKAVVKKEDAVSVAVFRRFSRLDWDYLSLLADPPHDLPADTQ